MQERKNHKRHAERIQEHQNRNGRNNDGLQTEQADEIRNHRKDDNPNTVLDAAAGQIHEVSGSTADQTDRSRQASQNHHGRQKHRTAIAEKKLGAQSKDWSTGFLNADCAHAFRADLRNENVNNAEHRSGNQRSLEHFTCNIGLLCKAGITDNPDRKRRENQGGDRVKRVVAIKDPLDNCHHRSRIGSGGSLRFAHRSDEALNNKDHQRQNQQRRKNLADTIHKLGRRRSKPTGYA